MQRRPELVLFDLGGVRRYETEALVELSTLCRRLTSYGCEVIVAAHDPGIVLELRRLAHGDDWTIAPNGSALATWPKTPGKIVNGRTAPEKNVIVSAEMASVPRASMTQNAVSPTR